MRLRITVLFCLLAACAVCAADPTPSPTGAEVYFIAPADGDTLSNPVRIRFGLRGMGIAPAGVPFENTGHHHLLIDAEAPPAGQPIPADAQHVHFGKGQTEVELSLPAGKHTLRLLLGDFAHLPHQPPVISKPIIIEVR